MPTTPTTPTPTPLPPSLSSHQDGTAATRIAQRRPASRPPSQAGNTKTLLVSAAGGVAPPRAPLPTCQPQSPATNATGKKATKPTTLPRLSVPPTDNMAAAAAAISPAPAPDAPKISMTSKEWVIPPRPKPGRKPATDTPPTKRKAQNRAAQRAFRERRAARVGELELLLDEQRDAHTKDETDLKEKVRSLELDLHSFRSRCVLLENMLDRERQERIRAETEAETLRRRHSDDGFRSHNLTATRQHSYSKSRGHASESRPVRHSLSDGRPTQDRNFSISQIISPPESLDAPSSNNDAADAAITCGNCSPNGPCACAEEVLASTTTGCGKCGFGTSCQCLDEMANATSHTHELKRLASSMSASSAKRQKSTASAATEIDFTAMYSKKSAPQSPFEEPPSEAQVPSAESMNFKEDCGFCKDGTYCVCAEDAGMATPAMTPPETAPTASMHQTQTPPPSEPDVLPGPMAMEMTADGSVKLPRRGNARKLLPSSSAASKSDAGCGTNGPGTCAQCQADPKSGLFCRLMNAKFTREQGNSSGGCCGGKASGGGCCKSKTPSAGPPQQPAKITLPSLPSLGLSCAEAYQTLSSHRNFDKAADDISSWLPKLRTTPHDVEQQPPRGGRHDVEVEAASIMSVLKEFDVRFGREC